MCSGLGVSVVWKLFRNRGVDKKGPRNMGLHVHDVAAHAT